MCLDKEIGTPAQTSGIGYKVLLSYKGALISPINRTTVTKWVENEWLQADQFHIYLEPEDARYLLNDVHNNPYDFRVRTPDGERHSVDHAELRKIEYTDAFVEGTGDGGWNYHAKVVLAKRARLLPKDQ